jgi:ribonuclease VapC
MIVVDASALVSIGDVEPDRDAYIHAIASNDCVMSSINYVETGVVLISRRRMAAKADFDGWLAQLGVEVRGAEDLAIPALEAYLTWGRGFHPARLNLADCFAYALAKQLDSPLLYKGNDFTRTDIVRAI